MENIVRECVEKYWDGKSSRFIEKSFIHFEDVDRKLLTDTNSTAQSNRSRRGSFFEGLIAQSLQLMGIPIFFEQATLQFVPDARFDFIVLTKKRIYCLSVKTSLRERYKQTAFEGFALKNVHRNARVVLLTLPCKELLGVSLKIASGEVFGIDNVIDCTTDRFDDLLKEISASEVIGNKTLLLVKKHKITKTKRLSNVA